MHALRTLRTNRKHRYMINAAIVGLGRWGQNLVNSVQGKSDKIRFTTGVLRNPEKAREYAERQGLALERDLGKVLADPGIDAIVLATPHTVHAAQVIAAARAGKPVFTEKPFTLTSTDAAKALHAAAQAKVTLGVGFNWGAVSWNGANDAGCRVTVGDRVVIDNTAPNQSSAVCSDYRGV